MICQNHRNLKKTVNLIQFPWGNLVKLLIFLKEIIVGKTFVNEITVDFAFELLSHMKGGPSIKVLLDVALGLSLIHI